jgi:hypothetical protein
MMEMSRLPIHSSQDSHANAWLARNTSHCVNSRSVASLTRHGWNAANEPAAASQKMTHSALMKTSTTPENVRLRPSTQLTMA